MRTTLTIDEEIASAIERLRERNNLSLRAAVNLLLRAGLRTTGTQRSSRHYEGESFSMGLAPGIDPLRLNQLADELEAEAFRG